MVRTIDGLSGPLNSGNVTGKPEHVNNLDHEMLLSYIVAIFWERLMSFAQWSAGARVLVALAIVAIIWLVLWGLL